MTTQDDIDVDAWIEMFRALGMSDADMQRWHAIFESRHPAGHQRFLEWLGLAPERVEQVRTRSRANPGG